MFRFWSWIHSLNNNNYGFLHNIHDLFLKGFLFSYFFFPLGPPPYPEGNSNSTSNFPSFSQSVFFLFSLLNLYPTLREILILLYTFLFSLLSFFFFLFCIWTSSLPLGRFQFSFLFYLRVFFPLEPSPSPASHSPSFHQSFFFSFEPQPCLLGIQLLPLLFLQFFFFFCIWTFPLMEGISNNTSHFFISPKGLFYQTPKCLGITNDPSWRG